MHGAPGPWRTSHAARSDLQARTRTCHALGANWRAVLHGALTNGVAVEAVGTLLGGAREDAARLAGNLALLLAGFHIGGDVRDFAENCRVVALAGLFLHRGGHLEGCVRNGALLAFCHLLQLDAQRVDVLLALVQRLEFMIKGGIVRLRREGEWRCKG